MKLLVTLKDPDTLYDAIQDAERTLTKQLMADLSLTKDEAEVVAQKRCEKMNEFANKYFEWGEYITIEFDDEQKYARVLDKRDPQL